jgi:tetratricopeptide (TPR) repeat protein/tRNA A-37 threonylcarbamoyl transferase component Bud32
VTGERWKEIERLFEAALELPPEERAAFLDRECESDLRPEVEAMLAADTGFGEAVAAAVSSHAASAASSGEARIGKHIGPWRLKSILGHGGTGTVYLAVRDDQTFQKQAAIKFIRRGMDTALVMKHFRRERQILARLEHPYIARLFDGGATDDGTPYFVMEYVDGAPITTYCTQHNLNLRDRLRLFGEVCAAVQSAHQSLVVHRDLKPGNILVTHDGTPKLLDFGLAKLLVPDLEGGQTTLGFRMMTPDYASPEQVKAEPVTTATDVYSLGVVLYELLTGQRPYRVKTTSWAELERHVCQTDPTSPGMLVPELRGDLETIVLKAMRKDPARRYASAEQLGEDVRRYLNGLPILARKDTLLYRGGKFLRRHRWASMAAGIFAVALVSSASVAIVQAQRARTQLGGVRTLARTILEDVNEQIRWLPGSVEARNLMVKTGLEYLDRVRSDARGDPAIIFELARGYEAIAQLQASPDPVEPILFDLQNGLTSYRRALEYTEQAARTRGYDQDVLWLLCRAHLGIGNLEQDNEKAFAHLKEALRLSEQLAPGTGKRRFVAHDRTPKQDVHDMALLFMGLRTLMQDPFAALDLFRQNWEIYRAAVAPYAYFGMGDLDSALAGTLEYEERLESRMKETSGPGVVMVYDTHATNRAFSAVIYAHPFLLSMNDADAGVRAARRAVEAARQAVAVDPTGLRFQMHLCSAKEALASALAMKEPAEAVALYREILADPVYPGKGNDFNVISRARWELSVPLRKLGQKHEALETAIQGEKETPNTYSHIAAGDAYLDLGRRESALASYRAAIEAAEGFVKWAPKNMVAKADAASAYTAMGRLAEAGADWKAARMWYGKAHDVWVGWAKAGGVSSAAIQRRERDVAGMLARAEAKAR